MSASASESASTTMPPETSEQFPAASSSSSAHEGDEKKREHNFNEQTFYVPRKQIVAIFLTLGLIDLIALMDQTTLAASLPIIGEKLHAGSQTSLISSAYFITSTAFQLLYGRISDIVGRKPLLLALLALFFVGSLGSSLADTYAILILFRAIVGIAGGGIMTVAQIIVSDVVSLRERGKYQGILGALVAVANGIGPVVGGALTTRTENTGGWRNIFRLSLPTSAAGIIGVLIFMPLKKVDGDWRAKARAIDYLGAFLSLAASTLIVLGFTWAGGRYEWTSVQVLAPLFVGLATAILFCLWQYKGDKPSRPALMPLYMFTNATVCGACITQFINGWLFVSQVYMIPQFYQAVYGYDATKAGLMLIPLTVSQTITSTISGLLITWTGRYRELLLLGWTLWPTGLGLVSTLNQHSGMAKQIGFSLLTGVGVGLTLQPSLIAIQGAVPRKTMAVVTATRNFVRNLGGAIGLALCGTVVSLYLRSEPNDPLRANQRGFRTVFLILASLGAAGLVAAALLLKQSSVERHDDELLRQQAKHELQQRK